MTIRIVTPPDGEAITLAEVKEQLRLDGSAQDSLIGRLIAVVVDWVAGPSGWLGRSLLDQTLELTLDYFPHDRCDGITLRRPPLIEVDSITIDDGSSPLPVVDPATYTVRVDADGLARIYLAPHAVWPVVPGGLRGAIKVIYRAGYGTDAEDIDAGLRHAMIMTVVRLFENRGDAMPSLQADPQIRAMFAPYLVYGVR
jgi:uncharacterized phiE125 gp8 family phage protein